jgi:hypothetical protein
MLLLAVVALAGLRPWEDTSVAPHLAVSPGLGTAALGDSVEVAPAPAVGPGGVAAPRAAHASPVVVAAEPVPVSKRGDGGSHSVLAVSSGRALSRAAADPTPPVSSEPPSAPPSETQPVAAAPAPAPVASPAPVAAAPPQVAVVESPPPRGPGTAGGGIVPPPRVTCEGDEYIVTLSYESLETAEEELGTEILVQRLAGDDDESEFHLEGTLSDARALIDLLVSEGNCVQVVEPPAAGEPAAEIPLAE